MSSCLFFSGPQECRKSVSPTLLARSDSDSLQVAAVGEDLGRGGHDPVGTRNWAAVQQGQREGTRTDAREHRGPAVLPRLLGTSHQDVRHGPELRVRKLPYGGPSLRREPPDAHVRGHLTVQGTVPCFSRHGEGDHRSEPQTPVRCRAQPELLRDAWCPGIPREPHKLVLERAANRRACGEEIRNGQQDFADGMSSKKFELRDASEMGETGIDRDLSQLLFERGAQDGVSAFDRVQHGDVEDSPTVHLCSWGVARRSGGLRHPTQHQSKLEVAGGWRGPPSATVSQFRLGWRLPSPVALITRKFSSTVNQMRSSPNSLREWPMVWYRSSVGNGVLRPWLLWPVLLWPVLLWPVLLWPVLGVLLWPFLLWPGLILGLQTADPKPQNHENLNPQNLTPKNLNPRNLNSRIPTFN